MKRVLIAGASGYVGGRLRATLEQRGQAVRCMARRPEHLQSRVAPQTEVVRGDCLDPETLGPAVEGIDTAYYLVHSMGSDSDFEVEDRIAAENFGRAARAAGVRRIVYLGGLGSVEEDLSAHLRSRQETGEVLKASGVETIEFRASIIIGSGSLSFEMIRALVERLPVMICPQWVATPAQPIAIEDVIDYLVSVLELPHGESRVFEIGGPDRVSYGDIMKEYASQRHLKRFLIPVPVLTPRLSSLWLGLVTPVYSRVGRKLVDSLRYPTVVNDTSAAETFSIRPRGLRDAIRRALENEDREMAETRWSDALSASTQPRSWAGVQFGTRLVDSRTIHVDCTTEAAFAPIRRIGGSNGWYYANWLWSLRGLIDLAFRGVGIRRGRRDPETLAPGDVVDWWRVDAFEPDRRLSLSAEMKLPGRAWLEFEVEEEDGGSLIRQTAVFDPIGLAGRAYWYAVFPLHAMVFRGMLAGIAAAATAESSSPAGQTA
jgi:uncharacterized protein YbjT (DUF2867 family)